VSWDSSELCISSPAQQTGSQLCFSFCSLLPSQDLSDLWAFLPRHLWWDCWHRTGVPPNHSTMYVDVMATSPLQGSCVHLLLPCLQSPSPWLGWSQDTTNAPGVWLELWFTLLTAEVNILSEEQHLPWSLTTCKPLFTLLSNPHPSSPAHLSCPLSSQLTC